MNSNIILPKKCKVGFDPRSDTYTGMLGYVIFHDGKVWRKEKSWEGWRTKFRDPAEYKRLKQKEYDRVINEAVKKRKVYGYYGNGWLNQPIKGREEAMDVLPFSDFKPSLGKWSDNEKVKPLEFDNEPIEGFVLNKKAGGYSTGWNHRNTYCRVYDPRGFEFEITIPNLLYILANTNSIIGKGLEGKFVYGWEGKELVLIPESAPEFEEMMNFTKLQEKKVAKKDLVVGGIYRMADAREEIYLGDRICYDYNGKTNEKKTPVWCRQNYNNVWNAFSHSSSMTRVKEFVGMADSELFAGIMDRVEKQDAYKTRTVTYKKVTDISGVKNDYSYYWRSRHNYTTYYIQEKNKYRPVKVAHDTYHSQYGEVKEPWSIQIGRKDPETFKSAKELLNKYELWQQKTTK